MLHELLTSKREEIIARTKAKVAVRSGSSTPRPEGGFGVSLFIDQLVQTLKDSKATTTAMSVSAKRHGNEMLHEGFTVDEVVHDYGNVCQAVTELALEQNAAITVDEFHTLNRCLDDAMAQAVREYGRLRERTMSAQGNERIGTFAHELRNSLTTAILSFSILESGDAPINGSTGALLKRSLMGLSHLIDRSLAEIRMESNAPNRETILVAELVKEIEIAAGMEAKSRGVHLEVEPVDSGVAIHADRQHISAAVGNLLQNAFKFTHEHGRVTFRAHATTDRVLFEIEDECGGLPSGLAESLFRPFNQRSTDRSGLGFGLTISRRGVALNGGEIRMRDMPGVGCVFTIEMPRSANH